MSFIMKHIKTIWSIAGIIMTTCGYVLIMITVEKLIPGSEGVFAGLALIYCGSIYIKEGE